MSVPKTETRAAFARRIGVNKSTITRAAEAGRLVLTPAGHVIIEKSLVKWHATKGGRNDVSARHAENRGADIPEHSQGQKNAPAAFNPPNNATHETTEPQPGGGSSGRTRAKTIGLHYENQSIKLEMALRRGLRYPIPLVRQEAAGIGSTVRAAIERIIDQTAPRLAVMTSDLDRRRLLDEEAARLRRVIKSELPRALRRMRAAGGKTSGADA